MCDTWAILSYYKLYLYSPHGLWHWVAFCIFTATVIICSINWWLAFFTIYKLFCMACFSIIGFIIFYAILNLECYLECWSLSITYIAKGFLPRLWPPFPSMRKTSYQKTFRLRKNTTSKLVTMVWKFDTLYLGFFSYRYSCCNKVFWQK